MKAPLFWQSKNLMSALMLPPAWLYSLGRRLRNLCTTPLVVPVPVICVGNLTAGGAGKTPVALHIGHKLKEKKIHAFFLSRGYGGTMRGPVVVDTTKHTAREVGDEPMLLARLLPTVIARDRASGARLAVAQGAKAIIMDDGFQNPAVAKTLPLLVIDGRQGLGNGLTIPAGPLREPAHEGFARARAVIVINPTATLTLPEGIPALFAKPALVRPDEVEGRTLFAFCGIGNPQKFFTLLAESGARLAGTVAFADHYRYQEADVKPLLERARAQNAALITTAKDAVRLPAGYRDRVAVADMTLAFGDEGALDKLLDFALKSG